MPRKRRQPPVPDSHNDKNTIKNDNEVNEYTMERIQSTSKSLGVSEIVLADNDNRLSCSQTSNNLHRDPLHTSTAIKQRGKQKDAQPHAIQSHTGNFTSNHEVVYTSEMENDQPQNSHHSDVMEGKTVTGRNIRLEVIHHDSNSCCEFVVSSPKFSFPKWLCLTALFNAMGFLFNLHSQVC